MSAKRLSLTALVACLTALTASAALHLVWPTPGPAPAHAGGVAGAVVSRVADRATLVKVAKHYVRLQAERQIGVTVDKQKVTGYWKHGPVVVVSLHEQLSNWNATKAFDVDVTFNQGAWQPLGMRVVTIRGGSAPPIGIPAPAS